MANTDIFVNVTVTKTSASVTRQGFSTPLGVFQVSTGIIPTRVGSYASLIEMTDAGFLVTDSAYRWAETALGQEASPNRVKVGRRVVGTAMVDTVTISTPDPGLWSVDVDGITYAFTGGAGATNQSIAEGLRDAIAASDTDTTLDGTNVLVTAGALAGGIFTVTSWVAGEDFVNGGIVVPGGGAGTFASTVAGVPAENITTALNAIQAEDDDFYIVTVESRQDADILLANTWVASQKKLLIAQTSDQDVLTTTVGNIGLLLAATNNKRTQCFWYHRPKDFADGAMSGRASAFKLDDFDGRQTWATKQLQVIVTSKLSSAEITGLQASGCDAHISAGGRGVTINGASVEGEFMDVQSTIDWTETRVKEDVFTVMATSEVSYTDEGIAVIKGAVQGVLLVGVDNNHFSSDDPNLPKTTAPTALSATSADRNARILRNVVGEARLAGSVHHAIIQVNVTA